MSFRDWFISLSIVSQGSSMFSMCQNFLPLQGWIISYCMMDHIFVYPSIHPPIHGYLGCSHLLAVVNDAAMDMGVQVSIPVPAFSSFGFTLRSRIARSDDNSVFNFLKNRHTVFPSSISQPTNTAQGFQFLHILTNTYYFLNN